MRKIRLMPSRSIDFLTLLNNRGIWKNLVRLKGMSVSQKINFIARTLAGEVLRSRKMGIFTLRVVEISLTDHCQCFCKHCYARTQRSINELKMDEIIPILDEMNRIGVPEVCFTGGEPLLHPSIYQLIFICRRKTLVYPTHNKCCPSR